MSDHTPGQWTAVFYNVGSRFAILDKLSRVIAYAVHDNYEERDVTHPAHQKTNHANAALLAAAPQLQDALRELLPILTEMRSVLLDDGYLTADEIDQWDSAIAKSTAALNDSRSTGFILPIVYARPIVGEPSPSHPPASEHPPSTPDALPSSGP